jgi:hypothetical protein
MPTKVFADTTTGWTNGGQIVDGDEGTFGFITASSPVPSTNDSDQQSILWDTLVFTDYHKIDLHVRYSSNLESEGAGGPDHGSARAHIEYQSGAGFIDIYPLEIVNDGETGGASETEAVIQLLIVGDFDLASLSVRGDVTTTSSGTGSGLAELKLHEVFVMVYADGGFGGFQPV